MRRANGWKRSWRSSILALAATLAATVGIAFGSARGGQEQGQDPEPEAPAKAKDPAAKKTKPARGGNAKKEKGSVRVPSAPPRSFRQAGPSYDLLLARLGNPPKWPYKYKLRAISQELHGDVGLVYFPSQLGTKAAVVMMVHEKGQTPIDFEQPIKELGDRGLAESMQKSGYAVLLVDLRNIETESRQNGGTKRERPSSTTELQVAYLFLLDRHNRGELNLSNLGVLAIGEGANLTTAWASARGAAVSGQDRVSDIASIALISPLPDLQGTRIQPALAALAPRIPLLLAAGERDAVSSQVVKDGRVIIARIAQSKAELFPTSLHGFKLMRLWPKVATAITKYFDTTTKFKTIQWEPRYNLAPLDFSSIEVTPIKGFQDQATQPAPAPKEPAADKKAGATKKR